MRWCLLLAVSFCGSVPKVSPERLAAMREAKDEETKKTAKDAGLVEQPFGEASDTEEKAAVTQGFMGIVFKYGAEKDAIKFLPPDQANARPYAGWSEVELLSRPLKKFPIQFWYLKTRFNGWGINSLFDLGATLTMLNWGAAERLGVRKSRFSSYGPPPTMLQDVLGKRAPALRASGLDVHLPGKSWFKQSAIIADAPVFSHFDLEEKPAAIVGLDLLRNNSLAVDFAGQKLFLGPTIVDGS